MMKYALLLALGLCSSAMGSEVSRIVLAQGGVIEARILDQRADRIVVDLGFSVLQIPMESVASIAELNPDGSLVSQNSDNLFRKESGSPFLSVKELAQHVGDAVVTVTTPVGLGSGFFIHESGYVVTNDHVVAGENKISVTVFEKEEGGEFVKKQYENVRIIASSAEWDLALLKIENTEGRLFKTVPLGDSSKLRQGQRIFAIGNPLGLERSVSEGIVSIQNRLINGRLFIQATAQISPGNSGGPLFNMRGEVVGVNNMKVSGFGAEGLGFAIPSETLENFINNRDTFAFDPRNPNSGFRYNTPPNLSKANDDQQ
ncbi:MAG: trypsin-like peptidase domain-containing protein [Opitutales bacterium]|nr:trypsin-like peptidase domain-containing protein [Opitutales bacterium]